MSYFVRLIIYKLFMVLYPCRLTTMFYIIVTFSLSKSIILPKAANCTIDINEFLFILGKR